MNSEDREKARDLIRNHGWIEYGIIHEKPTTLLWGEPIKILYEDMDGYLCECTAKYIVPPASAEYFIALDGAAKGNRMRKVVAWRPTEKWLEDHAEEVDREPTYEQKYTYRFRRKPKPGDEAVLVRNIRHAINNSDQYPIPIAEAMKNRIKSMDREPYEGFWNMENVRVERETIDAVIAAIKTVPTFTVGEQEGKEND